MKRLEDQQETTRESIAQTDVRNVRAFTHNVHTAAIRAETKTDSDRKDLAPDYKEEIQSRAPIAHVLIMPKENKAKDTNPMATNHASKAINHASVSTKETISHASKAINHANATTRRMENMLHRPAHPIAQGTTIKTKKNTIETTFNPVSKVNIHLRPAHPIVPVTTTKAKEAISPDSAVATNPDNREAINPDNAHRATTPMRNIT